MFDELNKYKESNHFFFKTTDKFEQVCNAPTNKSGVYLIYAIINTLVDLIYVGRSGKLNEDGTIFIRKTGLGGIKDRLVNGKQFGEARRISLRNQMIKEKIETLDIYWYVTHNDHFADCPRILENKLLQSYLNSFGELPKWNKEL